MALQRMPRSCCAVCGSSPVLRSHLLPRALYSRLRGDEVVIGPVRVERGRANTSSKQVAIPLLCGPSEQRLGLIVDRPACEFAEGGSRSRQALQEIRSAPTAARLQGALVKDAGDLKSISSLVRFGLSVLLRWDLGGEAWMCSRAYPSLGPFRGPIQSALFHDSAFPERVSVDLAFLAPSTMPSTNMLVLPEVKRRQGPFVSDWWIPGIYFRVSVGRSKGADSLSHCRVLLVDDPLKFAPYREAARSVVSASRHGKLAKWVDSQN
ncbi:hypothetical protein Pla163_23140 [Planctomycetes bacterium Pla163]|uniref:Uncharacterized protein n=1 Tax=Rohdeia mirabilis TaxID=2528008 RepID=A0A518D119_9BACT|nr:hypothetical protein Pla163_23140 [Planctomycetes bacterium Pla163]